MPWIETEPMNEKVKFISAVAFQDSLEHDGIRIQVEVRAA